MTAHYTAGPAARPKETGRNGRKWRFFAAAGAH
jgi:hypothetical protein